MERPRAPKQSNAWLLSLEFFSESHSKALGKFSPAELSGSPRDGEVKSQRFSWQGESTLASVVTQLHPDLVNEVRVRQLRPVRP